MSRQSAASLSVVPIALPQRLDPPSHLTETQADLWRAVVASKPVDWFGADSAPLLAEYVRAVEMCDRLADRIEHGSDTHEMRPEMVLKTLLDMRDKESKRVASLATKLRLTQQSRYTPKAASTANGKAGNARPWQQAQG